MAAFVLGYEVRTFPYDRPLISVPVRERHEAVEAVVSLFGRTSGDYDIVPVYRPQTGSHQCACGCGCSNRFYRDYSYCRACAAGCCGEDE